MVIELDERKITTLSTTQSAFHLDWNADLWSVCSSWPFCYYRTVEINY